MRAQQLIEDDLNRCSAKHANKSTLVARCADMLLYPSCISAPLASNMEWWNPILFPSHCLCLSEETPKSVIRKEAALCRFCVTSATVAHQAARKLRNVNKRTW